MTSVIRAISLAANLGRFLWRHKRLTLALAVAMGLLIVLPLLTSGGGGTFFLNIIGLGMVALVVRGLAQVWKGRQKAPARSTRR